MSQFYDQASLVVVPSGYKAGTVYAQKPLTTDGQLAFTRTGDTASRVNSAGLIEMVRTNLALYSEQFDNAYWVKYSSTITANTSETTDPLGGNAADIFVSANTTAGCGMESNAIPYTSGVEYTVSVYCKYKNTSFFQLLAPGSVTFDYVTFNIQTGTIVGGSYSRTPTITSVGNGWYRCSFTFVSGYTGTTAIGVAQLVDSASSTRGQAFTGDGVKAVYIFGAQVETGVATAYIPTLTAAVSTGPTANVPRLDYLGSTCGKLLLEPQRTNLVTYSEQFNNAAWTKSGSGTGSAAVVTANYGISPDGYANADRVQLNKGAGTSSSDFSLIQQAITYVTTGTSSIWMKSADGNNYTVALRSVSFSLCQVTSEWQRFTYTESNMALLQLILRGTYGTSNTADILVWGAQLEAGAYATSYIPTLAASATRGADACSKTGISSLIGQTEGTLFVDAVFANNYESNNMLMTLSDGGGSNVIYINRSNGGAEFYVAVSGATQALYSGSILTAGVHKIAFAYKQNDFAMYVDGLQVATDTNGNIPACSKLNIGSYSNDGLPFNNGIRQSLLFKTRLTNAQLAELTTL